MRQIETQLEYSSTWKFTLKGPGPAARTKQNQPNISCSFVTNSKYFPLNQPCLHAISSVQPWKMQTRRLFWGWLIHFWMSVPDCVWNTVRLILWIYIFRKRGLGAHGCECLFGQSKPTYSVTLRPDHTPAHTPRQSCFKVKWIVTGTQDALCSLLRGLGNV